MRSACLLKGQDYLPRFFFFFFFVSHLRTAHLTRPSLAYDVVQAAMRRELTAIVLIFANQVKRVSDKCLTGVPLLNGSWRNDLVPSCKIDFVTWIMAPQCLHMFYVDCCKCLLRRALFYVVALFLALSRLHILILIFWQNYPLFRPVNCCLFRASRWLKVTSFYLPIFQRKCRVSTDWLPAGREGC